MAAEASNRQGKVPSRSSPRVAIVAARDEADRIAATLAALAEAVPGIRSWVADDASSDGTREAARAAGATVVGRGPSDSPLGKGGNVSVAAAAVAADLPADATVLLCDGDLGASAGNLAPLVAAVESGSCDLAIARFERRVGGGLGLAKGYARWAIVRLSGFESTAPISGQRAMRADVLRDVLPFAPRYGMEIGMTVDAVRAGHRVVEVGLDLEHRATGRTLRGFVHRGRQLRDFLAVHRSRRAGSAGPRS